MVKIAPSILAGDFLHLEKDIRMLNEHADLLHFDVMDGSLVPNLSFGFVMWMLKVADSVFSMSDVDGFVREHLYVLSVKYSIILLCDHVGNPGLAGIEVVADLLHVEGLVTLGHYRLAFPFMGKGIIGATGEDCPGVHIVLHVVGLELYVLVGDFHIAPIEHLSLPVDEYLPGGVFCS